MTSHHDVAWVVAELRNFGSGDTLAFVNTSKLAIAATILENQAKALSEAEVLINAARDSAVDARMNAFKWMERHDRIAAGKDGGEYPSPADVPSATARANAAEARLAEAMRALTAIAEHPKSYDDGKRSYAVGWAFWNVQNIARAFINAAKEKT